MRRQPDRVDAEIDEIIELAGDPREITDAIAVAVGERARVDLVEDGSLPPFQVGHGALLKCDSLFPTVEVFHDDRLFVRGNRHLAHAGPMIILP